ncbi:MAG: DUF4105 domain-containing protein [Rickettsiales bacterium]|nr:DUF4105 domain-containing protein [Rickettsiales bacterium]
MMKYLPPALAFFLHISSGTLAIAGGVSFDSLIKAQIYETAEWKNLLHYSGGRSVIDSQSSFFLSDTGYKDPKAEYVETIRQMLDSKLKDGDSIQCRYPARVNLIMEQSGVSVKELPAQKCAEFEEYEKKVPFDEVYVVFAAENNTSPTSMMGHTFLKISGANDAGPREHSFSYFAALDNTSMAKFLYRAITFGIEGIYALSPYKIKRQEYLINQNRSLWEFKLNLNEAEKYKLKNHLWELRNKFIRYSLITHNCNTALVGVLKTADADFDESTIKPFSTPVEYIQELSQKNRISEISFEPTGTGQKIIDKHGLNYILSAPEPTRLAISYEYSDNNYLRMEFNPIYQDLRDVSDAYFDELESKLLNFSARMNLESGRFVLDAFDLIKIKSIPDFTISDSFAKHFKISFENDLYDDATRLRPTAEFGLGLGLHAGHFKIYAIPTVGYRYSDFNNFYFTPEIGIISRITDYLKFMSSYKYYFNTNGDNRGYDSVFQAYLGYRLFRNKELSFEYLKYAGDAAHIAYRAGFTIHF